MNLLFKMNYFIAHYDPMLLKFAAFDNCYNMDIYNEIFYDYIYLNKFAKNCCYIFTTVILLLIYSRKV